MGAASLQHACFAADRTHARQDRRGDSARRRLPVRAQVGRIPRDRISSRGRRLHPEPRPQAPGPLLPGPARRFPRAAAERRRRGWRDRDADQTWARLRRPADAAAPRGLAGREARQGGAGRVRGVRPPRERQEPDARPAARTAYGARTALQEDAPSPLPHADDARPEARGRLAAALRGRRAGWRDRETRRGVV